MSDQVLVDNGDGTDYTVSTDDAGASGQIQRVKLAYSADGVATHVTADADGLLVNLGGNNDVTVTGTVTVQDGGSTISVDDGAGSLTVDNAALSVTGGGVEASALRVTLANDSTGVLSVDDNGSTLSVDDGAGSLTIDNAALSVTGGGVEASALRVTIASDSTGVLSVDDNGASLTIDNAALSVTGGGVEASALRVTIANDSTGVLSVDDNGSTLSIDDGAGSITVDGSVTANAGTNLNTSALALESGGNLAGAATSLAIVDDWDESDRAKVNIIAGQAGVTAGAGSVAANTQRVTLASDDPGVTALQLIDDAIQTDDGNGFTPGTNKVMMIGALADDTSGDSVNEGDAGALRMSLARALHVIEVGDTATLANVADTASSTTLQAANANRIGWTCFNDSTQALLIKFGATASATSFNVKVAAGQYYEMPVPIYRGIIDGIWEADASGSARVCEMT